MILHLIFFMVQFAVQVICVIPQSFLSVAIRGGEYAPSPFRASNFKFSNFILKNEKKTKFVPDI